METSGRVVIRQVVNFQRFKEGAVGCSARIAKNVDIDLVSPCRIRIESVKILSLIHI